MARITPDPFLSDVPCLPRNNLCRMEVALMLWCGEKKNDEFIAAFVKKHSGRIGVDGAFQIGSEFEKSMSLKNGFLQRTVFRSLKC